MIAVRPSYANKFDENEYLVEAFHPYAEKLDDKAKEGCVMVEEMPMRPESKDDKRRVRVINVEDEEVRWEYIPK